MLFLIHQWFLKQNMIPQKKNCSHLADAFIQRDLQMRTIEAIKTKKRATTCKCYYKYQLA